MSKLPSVTGKDLIAALGKVGFQVIRVKGSHHCVGGVHKLGMRTVIAALLGSRYAGKSLLTPVEHFFSFE